MPDHLPPFRVDEHAPEGGRPIAALQVRAASQPLVGKRPVNVPFGVAGESADARGTAVEQVLTLGEYSLVAAANGAKLRIFDSRGMEVRDFERIADLRQHIRWEPIGHEVIKTWLLELIIGQTWGRPNAHSHMRLEDFPEVLHPYLQTYLRHPEQAKEQQISWQAPSNQVPGGGVVHLLNLDEELETDELRLLNPHLQVLLGRYLVLTSRPISRTWKTVTSSETVEDDISDDGGVLVFDTKQEDGTDLPPRQWKRAEVSELFAAYGKDILPAELRRVLEHPGADWVEMGYGNIACVTTEGVQVLRLSDGLSLFNDPVADPRGNVFLRPGEPQKLYYCRYVAVSELIELDTSAPDSTQWRTKKLPFPEELAAVRCVIPAPTGNFLLVSTSGGVEVRGWDLELLQRFDGLSHPQFDATGQLRAVDAEQRLVICGLDVAKIEEHFRAREQAAKVAALKIDPFALTGVVSTSAPGIGAAPSEAEVPPEFLDLREHYENSFMDRLVRAQTLEDVSVAEQALDAIRRELSANGIDVPNVSFVTNRIALQVLAKMSELADVQAKVELDGIEQRLQSPLSINSIEEIRSRLALVERVRPVISPPMLTRFRALQDTFDTRAADIFRMQGEELREQVDAFERDERAKLDAIGSKPVFDDWLDRTYPEVKRRFTRLQQECPLECRDVRQRIIDAQARLEHRAEEREQEFLKKYEDIRERESQRTGELARQFDAELKKFLERLRQQRFRDRDAAKIYVEQSGTTAFVRDLLQQLAGRDADAAAYRDRALKVAFANFYEEVVRQASVTVGADGRILIAFGKETFPRFEAPVKKRQPRTMRLAFQPHFAPGADLSQVRGDVAVRITTSEGKIVERRLWEGDADEGAKRFSRGRDAGGVHNYLVPSYLTAEEFDHFSADARAWAQGSLRQELAEKRAALISHWGRRSEIPEDTRTGQPLDKEAWNAERERLMQEYLEFLRAHRVSLLRRIDAIKREPEPVFANGKGHVPEWAPYWVVDTETEGYLEQVARNAKMQLELQEGMIDLAGHAGTGKDVLLQMFAHRTNRPFFTFDCSKWTTEYELSSDITLEAVNGATQIAQLPSVVLHAIQTPGAILYFNEFNAMPEQTQIFLHALFDAKRAMTLKTKSGELVKADPTVLFFGSMNPNYPGTFAPQMATRSRIVTIRVNYPALARPAEANDPNQNPVYTASEALRMARSVDSLIDLTLDPDLATNPFVQAWNAHVNRIGTATLTKVQQYDMDVILSILQFGANLREAFISNFERSEEAVDALPVSQPFTMREMRRCAYLLSRLPEAKKIAETPNAEEKAKELITEYFLSSIDSDDDRAKVAAALGNWSMTRRLVAGAVPNPAAPRPRRPRRPPT